MSDDDPEPPKLTQVELDELEKASRINRMQTAVLRYLTWCLLGWFAISVFLCIYVPEFPWGLFLFAGIVFTGLIAIPFWGDWCFPVLRRSHQHMYKAWDRLDWEQREYARRTYGRDQSAGD